MSKIQTKIFNYGNEKESSWPAQFGTGEKGLFIFDKEASKTVPASEYLRKEVDAPSVITDEIAPTICHADGKIYTSKKAMHATHKRLGKIEIGNETQWRNTPSIDPNYEKKVEEAVARSYYEVRDNMAPLTELDKERCKIINRNIRENNYDRREYDRYGRLRD